MWFLIVGLNVFSSLFFYYRTRDIFHPILWINLIVLLKFLIPIFIQIKYEKTLYIPPEKINAYCIARNNHY